MYICEQLTHWKRPWCWEGLKAGGEGADRGWDGWMASQIQWTWTWANSVRWWGTGKPGMLQSMGLQRVGHDLLLNNNRVWWGYGLFYPVILPSLAPHPRGLHADRDNRGLQGSFLMFWSGSAWITSPTFYNWLQRRLGDVVQFVSPGELEKSEAWITSPVHTLVSQFLQTALTAVSGLDLQWKPDTTCCRHSVAP